jgi:hypothetical protein
MAAANVNAANTVASQYSRSSPRLGAGITDGDAEKRAVVHFTGTTEVQSFFKNPGFFRR